MARLKFDLYKDRFCEDNGGVMAEFTDGKGREQTTYFSSPPSDIDHVCIGYLNGRFGNATNSRHEAFIKAEFKKQMQDFPDLIDE